MPISADSWYNGTIKAPASPASADPNANVRPYSRVVEMPQARASIGFSNEPRILRPVVVLVRNSQLTAITTIVVAMMKVRHRAGGISPGGASG